MSFCNLNIEVLENYGEQHFAAMWRGGSSYLSVHYHRFCCCCTDVTFPYTDIIFK